MFKNTKDEHGGPLDRTADCAKRSVSKRARRNPDLGTDGGRCLGVVSAKIDDKNQWTDVIFIVYSFTNYKYIIDPIF